MFSTKCDKCKNKAWCWSCDDFQSKPFQFIVCNKIIKYRDRHDHLQVHFNNPNQYLVCRMCKVNKNITHYRCKLFYCWLFINLQRYRFILQKKDS